jgi:hypothetical protein
MLSSCSRRLVVPLGVLPLSRRDGRDPAAPLGPRPTTEPVIRAPSLGRLGTGWPACSSPDHPSTARNWLNSGRPAPHPASDRVTRPQAGGKHGTLPRQRLNGLGQFTAEFGERPVLRLKDRCDPRGGRRGVQNGFPFDGRRLAVLTHNSPEGGQIGTAFRVGVKTGHVNDDLKVHRRCTPAIEGVGPT